MRHFECDADVREDRMLQAELGPMPEPPADLWEQIERVRRVAGKMRARKVHPLSQPDLTALAFPEL